MMEKVYFAVMCVEFVLLCMAAAGLFMGGAKIGQLNTMLDDSERALERERETSASLTNKLTREQLRSALSETVGKFQINQKRSAGQIADFEKGFSAVRAANEELLKKNQRLNDDYTKLHEELSETRRDNELKEAVIESLTILGNNLEKELEVARRNDMEHDPITGKWTKKKGKKA